MVTNADLDEWHGHTHEIDWDGERKVMYHDHQNTEYPCSIDRCRGTPIELPHHLQHSPGDRATAPISTASAEGC